MCVTLVRKVTKYHVDSLFNLRVQNRQNPTWNTVKKNEVKNDLKFINIFFLPREVLSDCLNCIRIEGK